MEFGLAYTSYFDHSHRAKWGDFFGAVPGYNIAPVPVDGLKAMRDLGLRWINRTLFAHDIAQGPRLFTPQRFDQNVEACVKAGMNLFVNFASLPAWMTGGFPAWMVSRFGPQDWKDATDGSQGLRWRTPEEAPYCYPPNIPIPAYEHLYALGYYCGQRYHGAVKVMAPFNEPDEIESGNIMLRESQDAAMRVYHRAIATPLIRGWRAADPSILIAGPEAAYADGLRRCLEYEARDPNQSYDIVSEHLYAADDGGAKGTLAGAERRIQESTPIHAKYLKGRKLWCTEIQGGDACRKCFLPESVHSGPIALAHKYEPWNWLAEWFRRRQAEGRYAVALPYFTEQGTARIWQDWNGGDYRLTPFGEEIREIINGDDSQKRRAVRT